MHYFLTRLLHTTPMTLHSFHIHHCNSSHISTFPPPHHPGLYPPTFTLLFIYTYITPPPPPRHSLHFQHDLTPVCSLPFNICPSILRLPSSSSSPSTVTFPLLSSSTLSSIIGLRSSLLHFLTFSLATLHSVFLSVTLIPSFYKERNEC